MKVLVSGATGLVGHALFADATQAFTFHGLKRGDSGQAWWNPVTGEVDTHFWNTWQPEALVHLAGENIAKSRWNSKQKRKIEESRTGATERLADSILALEHRPSVFVCASAIGYYGDRGDEILTEKSSPGSDFLAQVVMRWEAAADRLRRAGVRVVHLRFGMILSGSGGALARLMPLFKLGAGGRLGNGQQWVSWVALSDVIRVIEWTLNQSHASGAYNVVSPAPVTNAEFTRTLAKLLRRPAFLRVPTPALRLVLGELADALLLSSQRAIPQRLMQEGFEFEFRDLESALRHESGEP